jgi:hypothetical protein
MRSSRNASPLPTSGQRTSGDVFDEHFFPDMTEEQFNNFPDKIRDVILEHYPHLNKYCDEEYKAKQARRELQIQARLARLKALLQEKRMLPNCYLLPLRQNRL